MGAPYLASCEGKFYWELRMVKAEGWAMAGFSGTSFCSGPRKYLGDNEASWAVYSKTGCCYLRYLTLLS